MEGIHTFSGWRTVQSFRGWTHPSLANSKGQLHPQDRLEGGENQFYVIGSPDIGLQKKMLNTYNTHTSLDNKES